MRARDGASLLILRPAVAVRVARPRSVPSPADRGHNVPSANARHNDPADTRRLVRSRQSIWTQACVRRGPRRAGGVFYISTGRSKMAVTLDTATNTVVGSVEAGDRPV